MLYLAPEYVRECFEYFPVSGRLIWKYRPRSHFNADTSYLSQKYGVEAGSTSNACGYRFIGIGGKTFLAHRLAWVHFFGEWPSSTIDHINHNRLDNRIINLRDSTVAENAKNRPATKMSDTGKQGVFWNPRERGWRVAIGNKGGSNYIGTYRDFFEACCARISAENRLGYHPNHGRKL